MCTPRWSRVTSRQARPAAEGHRGHRMGTRRRLDAELVRRGLARSREHAASLVSARRVLVAGQEAAKPATQVAPGDPITITEAGGPDYVSRGGRKLAGALAAFPDLNVAGRRCLDAGASTGGFTDVLLRAGAAHLVVADLSFISLTLVLPALVACAAPDADFLLMVKPQFEVGKQMVGGGVVR